MNAGTSITDDIEQVDPFAFEDVSVVAWDQARIIVQEAERRLEASRYAMEYMEVKKLDDRFYDLVMHLWGIKVRYGLGDTGNRAVDDASEKRAKVGTSREGVGFEDMSTMEMEINPSPCIIRGMLSANKVGIFTGPGEIGKTGLAASIAMSMSQSVVEEMSPILGSDLHIHPDYRRKGVIMLSWEDDSTGINERLQGMLRQYQNVHPHLPSNAWSWVPPVREMEDSYFLFRGGHKQEMPCIFNATDPRAPGWTEWGRRVFNQMALMEPSPSLLIIDNAAAAFNGNENDRSQVRMFMGALNSWALRHSCAVMVIAHPPKSDHKASGSTDWVNASRWHINAYKPSPVVRPMGDDDSYKRTEAQDLQRAHPMLYSQIMRGVPVSDINDKAQLIIDAINDPCRNVWVLECAKLNDGLKRRPIIVERNAYGTKWHYIQDISRHIGMPAAPKQGDQFK